MNENIYPALACAGVSLAVGLGVLALVITRAPKYFNTANTISWLLIALVPVFPLFAIFPDSSFSLETKGITAGGAIGAFIFIWLRGMRITERAHEIDRLLQTIADLEELLRQCRADTIPPEPLKVFAKHLYTVRGGKKIGLITGDIKNVRGVDVWVNSENTDMEMARFSDRSVSASIRYYGAKRDKEGDVIAGGDTIADLVKTEKGAKLRVEPATVYATEPGALKDMEVKQIFHVAAVQGPKATGYRAVDDLESCVTKPLDMANTRGYRSILFPLMTTGTAKGDLKPASTRLIMAALTYLESNSGPTVDTVYFLTYTDRDLKTCKEILAALGNRATPVPSP